jgi:hypothetical protein
LDIVCDDLNTLKTDVDRFMAQSSGDFAANYARFLALSNRLDNIDVQLGLITDQLSRMNQSSSGSGGQSGNASASNETSGGANESSSGNETLGGGDLGANIRETLIAAILDKIASEGLMVGPAWKIVQVGDNLWVQNNLNGSAQNTTESTGNATSEGSSSASVNPSGNATTSTNATVAGDQGLGFLGQASTSAN